MKHFRCYLSDLFLEAKIKVQDDHWETEEDFKEEIAPLFNLTKDQFQIDNMPPKYALTDNKKKYDINLTITNKSKDFVFQLPDKNQIPVTISHLTSIKFIMEEFKTHKIYFHQKTIDTLQFKLCGIKVPKDYNFCCIPEGSIVYISSKYNLIPIKYRDYQFFLSENQTIADAATLTSPFFKDCDIFQIHDSESHQMPSLLDKLRNDINYVLYLRRMINISHINGSSPKLNFIDYLTTVSELKGILASIYSGQEQLTPENIILMDSKKKEISDPKKTLISFQNKFFFDIKTDQPRPNKDQKIEWNINFEFEQNKKFNFLEKLPIEMKMKEISSLITNRYKIDDSNNIELFYEENYKRIKIDENKTINDVKAKIRPYGVNLIYVKINQSKSDDNNNNKEEELKDELNLADQKNKQKKKVENDSKTKQKKIKEKEININNKKSKIDNDDEVNKKIFYSKSEEEDSYSSSPNLLQLSKLINIDQNGTPKPKINLIKSEKTESPKLQKNEDEDEEDLSSSENKSNSIINIQKPSPKPRITLIQSDSDEEQINKNKSKQKQSNKIENLSPSKPPKSAQKVKPKIIPIDNDNNNNNNRSFSPTRNKNSSRLKQQKPQNKDDDKNGFNNKRPIESLKSKYSIKFNDIKKNIRLTDDVHLKDNEEIIKMWFKIDEKDSLDYFIYNKNGYGENEEEIDSEKVIMNSLKDKKILIKIHQNLNTYLAEENEKVAVKKYFYQINSGSKINDIELDSNATVLTLKKVIAEKNNVDNLANVKILFAGKDLLDDIVLESLQIGSTVLYVYIRSIEDILLMTAKALIVQK